MAARADAVSYDRLHRFIAAWIWDEAPPQRALLGEADRLVGGADLVLIVDDTALPKRSTRSVEGISSEIVRRVIFNQVDLGIFGGNLPAQECRLFLPGSTNSSC